MADSDNSRTLPTVTRGDFHSLVAARLPTYPEVATHQNPGFRRCGDDPAAAAWQRWWDASQRLSESNATQQRIEARLFQAADGPVERDPGYSEALEAEDCAAIAEDKAAEALWDIPAQSVAGVTAKLHAILSRSQPSPTSPDEPWPQLRGLMADLLAFDAAVDPPRRLAAHEPKAALQNS